MIDDPMFWKIVGIVLLSAAVVMPIALRRYDRKQKNNHNRYSR